MASITDKALDRIKQIVQAEFPDKKTQILIAVAIPTEEKGLAQLGMMIKGGNGFKEEIMLNLAKQSGNCIEIPINEIFPPTPKKDVN